MKIQKLVGIMLIVTLLTYVILNYILENKAQAAIVQTREQYSDKINQYAGYKEKIDALKAKHPNWNFTIFYTGLDWNQVIKNESVASHGRNLVPSSKGSEWICSVCGNKPYDNGSWRCASEEAVAYYMDPRNSLNEDYIFQFETLSYKADVQNIEGVRKILSDAPYLLADTITYTTTSGTTATINKSYPQVIMEAAQENNISPYHLAARIRQEQGVGNSASATASGTYSGYTGYYNFCNIGATGSGQAQVIANALNRAKSEGWTTPELSIKGGAKYLAEDYISTGQDTLYLQKFDVDNSDGQLYWFQYMQNLSASKTEALEVKKSYQSLGLIEANFDFVIPVYENMPSSPCMEPGTAGIVTEDVKVKGTKVQVREAPGTSSTSIAEVNMPDVLLRIEMATTQVNGYFWDKVVLPDGRKGYIARNYLVAISDVTNCNDTMFATTGVYVRNGPGTTETREITMLSRGQQVTRIETGKYNGLDGYNWDRVILADGRKGYVASQYLQASNPDNGNTNNGEQVLEQIRVICPSGVKVREEPGTEEKVLTYLDNGDIATRTEAGVSNANGYTWDKITTAEGIIGYIARGDSSGPYIEVIGQIEPTPEPDDEKSVKLVGTTIYCEPKTDVQTLVDGNPGKTVVVKDLKGNVVKEGLLGTGYQITIDGNHSEIAKLGDINGDGKINSADTLMIKRNILGELELKENYKQQAGDLNGDGKINSADSLMTKRYILGEYQIIID